MTKFGVKEEDGFTDNMEKTLHVSFVVSGKDVDLTDPVNWFLNDCNNLKFDVKLNRADCKIYYTSENGTDNKPK